MHDFADSFVQAVLYICFLAALCFIIASCLFSAIHWFINWMVS